MKESNVFKICLVAAMASLAVVLELFSIDFPMYKITLYPLPLLLAGILYGPTFGLTTGIVVGFFNQLFSHGLGVTTPLWMLAPMFWGLISGLLSMLFNKRKDIIIIMIIIAITSLICTATNTVVMYLDALIYEYPIELTFIIIINRFLISCCHIALYISIIYLVLKAINSENDDSKDFTEDNLLGQKKE